MCLITQTVAEGFQPEPDYTVTQWADKKRFLPDKGSVEPGRYRSDRTPYVKEIGDNLSIFSGVQETVVMKGTQLGMTETGNNFFGYVVDAAPGPMLMIFPTDNLASDHSKQKLTPSIEATPAMKDKISPGTAKSHGNTILTKDFPNGILFMSGANSPANYRSKTVRYLFLDDLDGFPVEVGDDGCPVELAIKRTDNYDQRKKIYLVSTPTIKGISKIEAAYKKSDQRSYHVPCPFCGKHQKLVWGGKNAKFGIKFKRDSAGDVVAAWYECKHCHEGIDESHKTEMLARGKWIAKYPKRKKRRGYHLSSLYSPLGWVSWEQVAQEFIEAKSNPVKLKVWTNTRMAETWDEKGSQPDWVVIKTRAEPYKIRTVPDKALFLTAGVDVQEDRLPVLVKAWAEGEENYTVYWQELWGDPAQQMVWDQLDLILNHSFIHESGRPLHIDSVGIDTGFHTQAVYNYCRARPIKAMAVKGASVPGKPIVSGSSPVDVNWQGEKIKDGCLLWMIGTDTAKAQIYSRLSLEKPGPGYCHHPIGLEDEFYKQLTAEKKITEYSKGYPKPVWMKLRPRNEVLDCEVYAYAAALRAGMAHFNWQKIRAVRIDQSPGGSAPRKKRAKKQQPQRSRW